jgi:hypothetical protein
LDAPRTYVEDGFVAFVWQDHRAFVFRPPAESVAWYRELFESRYWQRVVESRPDDEFAAADATEAGFGRLDALAPKSVRLC